MGIFLWSYFNIIFILTIVYIIQYNVIEVMTWRKNGSCFQPWYWSCEEER